MKKITALIAFAPLLAWLLGMILFVLLALFGVDCPVYEEAALLCAIPNTLTWGGFGVIFLAYSIPLAAGLYIVHKIYTRLR